MKTKIEIDVPEGFRIKKIDDNAQSRRDNSCYMTIELEEYTDYMVKIEADLKQSRRINLAVILMLLISILWIIK